MDKLGKVELAAKRENGWHVVAISKDRHSPGTVPSGVIAFVRTDMPDSQPDLPRCGTARWAENGLGDLGIHFYNGHYDQRRDDAMVDFATRTLGYGASVIGA